MLQFVIKNQDGEYLSRLDMTATGCVVNTNPNMSKAIKFDSMKFALVLITNCDVLEPLTLDVYDLDVMLKYEEDNRPVSQEDVDLWGIQS